MRRAGNRPAPRRDAGPTPGDSQKRAPRQQSLSLSAVEPAPRRPPRATPGRETRPEPLWLCLYLPSLPLDTADAYGESPLLAVFEEVQGVREVLDASAEARAAGVHPGLPVNAALALAPGLELAERDPGRERRALESLAAWAERFTSFVTLEPPDLLLLEIAASLRLFDGLKLLRRRIVRELLELGHAARPAIAPTPLAATWLARAGSRACILERRRLAAVLGRQPLDCLAWPEKLAAALEGMGLERVGDLLRLPRDGFAKRFGASRLLELDRALGRLPDPRAHYRAPVRFCEDLDLDGEEEAEERLLEACGRLLYSLEDFLRRRQLAAQRLRFRFYHLERPATRFALGAFAAGQSAARWLELLRIRLERVELPAPVIAIRLQADDGQPLAAKTDAFAFGDGRRDTAIAPLVERLAARIGETAVHGLHTVAEYRPDYAFGTRHVLADAPQCRAMPQAADLPALHADARRAERLLLRRPLWLLEEPEPLACREDRPCRGGPLELESGPERIETGWWDERGIARDYYVAKAPDGAWLWVFRDRRDGGRGGWYLHGLFG